VTTREQWIAGARPKTLPAAIAPVLVGTAFAGYNAKALNFFLALIVALSLQVAVNYANDYSDGIRGGDTDRIGPLRLVGSGAATAQSVKRAALIAFGVAALAGLVLAARTSWLLLLIGAISIIAAWTYTGGPKPYGYFALGELSVFIFFGIVATLGTYYVHLEELALDVTLASIALGSLACALLVINNLRDLERDAKVGKLTLAVRLGDARTRALYQLLLIAPLIIALALTFDSRYFLLTFIALPQLLRIRSAIRAGATGAALIELLGKTGRIQMIYAASLSLAALLAQR
jgi:1,4-dihydroxy-2-naphthoate octaprenyltransferase